jgi:hypothetical protein
MKPRGLLVSIGASSLLVACGRLAPLQDLPCPCDTGFICCNNVCVAGASCSTANGFGDGDAGAPNGDGPNDAEASHGTNESAYCYYPSNDDDSDAGYDCLYANGDNGGDGLDFTCGCTGTFGNVAAAAQTELDCMASGGSIVTVCPSQGLVGCCTTGDYAVGCSYGADMQYELHCLANGGTWSKAAPP